LPPTPPAAAPLPGHATTPPDTRPAKARGRVGLRDARIRAKLALILLVPLVAIGALATARLVEGGARVAGADLARSLVAVSVEASEVGHQLHRERIEAVRLLSDPGGGAGGFNRQTAGTDEAITSYRATVAGLGRVPQPAGVRLTAVDGQLDALAGLRQHVAGGLPAPPVAAVVLRYAAVLADIGAWQDTLPGMVEDPGLAEQARAVAAVSKAKAHAADAEAIAQAAAATGLTAQAREALRATQTGQQEAFVAFRQAAGPPQRAITDRAITGANVDAAETATAALLQPTTGDGHGDGFDTGGEVAVAAAGLAGMLDVTRFVEQQLYEQLLDSVTGTRNRVFQRVLAESAAVLLALVVAVLVALLLARALAGSLRRLRDSAVTVAQRDLPAAVARLSDPRALAEHGPADLAAQIRPPDQLHSRDEIGEVAHALHQVHQVAVRTAAEQAALRTSVSAMFLNLARRSQTLVDHMINRLDRLQRDETDHDRLQQMFALDNLATRMRRNDENLLVLAGADSSPPRHRDALLADVLQAAQSEIEHYHRIEFGTVDNDVHVAAAAINDVVRLLAELFDNATRFSPPDSAVVCEARRLGDRLIVHIEDRGVGITDDGVDTLNTWLARPGELDVTTFRRMGIAVVARLAARHHIHVTLRAHPHHGTTATVTLPPPILILPASRQRAFAPSTRHPLPVTSALSPRPVPERQVSRLPQRSSDVIHHAASRHTNPDPTPPAQTPLAPAAPAPPPAVLGDCEVPVAGRSAYLTAVHHQPPSPPGPPTIELAIFQQVQTAWFNDHGDHSPTRSCDQPHTADHATSTYPPDTRAARLPRAGEQTVAPWQTAADTGWAAAAAAANPSPGGTTTSGLPTRVPQAQLVPGGVHPPPAATVPAPRRTPEEVRGLLSAYQRGVQRGRESWS
jgi:signal transduction histidine kinase